MTRTTQRTYFIHIRSNNTNREKKRTLVHRYSPQRDSVIFNWTVPRTVYYIEIETIRRKKKKKSTTERNHYYVG